MLEWSAKEMQTWANSSLKLQWFKTGEEVFLGGRKGGRKSTEGAVTSHSMCRYMEIFTITTTQPKNIFSRFRGQLRCGCLKSHPWCGVEVHGGNHWARKKKVFQFTCYIKQLNAQEEVGEWGHQGHLLHNCKRRCFQQGETFSMSL